LIYGTNVTNDTIFYPTQGANAITMASLLLESGLDIDYIMKNGAILRINFDYNCDLKYPDCYPSVSFDQLTDD
jgi:hypothetical protein